MNISTLYNNMLAESNRTLNNPLEKLSIDTRAENRISKNDNISFKDIINNEIDKLNQKQIKADELTESLISGQVEDLHTIMIAAEEARLSLELAVQIRNKCIEAFKEINNMQL